MRLFRPLAAVAVSTLLLAACFTGKRPTLAAPVVAVTDPAIQAVLQRLETAVQGPFTADYTIVTKLTAGGTATPTTPAVVTQTDATTKSITIGNIRFLDQATPQTCNLTTAQCVANLDDAQTSNLIVGHDFYEKSAAAKLRQDATTMITAAVPSTRVIAGQTATCVMVNFAAGAKTYCAIDGLLAAQDTPDLTIDLVAYSATSDPAQFASTTTTVAG